MYRSFSLLGICVLCLSCLLSLWHPHLTPSCDRTCLIYLVRIFGFSKICPSRKSNDGVRLYQSRTCTGKLVPGTRCQAVRRTKSNEVERRRIQDETATKNNANLMETPKTRRNHTGSRLSGCNSNTKVPLTSAVFRASCGTQEHLE